MTDRNYPFNFDPRRVIDRFGGVNKTHEALIRVGCHVTPRAVRKWLERQTVPADAVIALHIYSTKHQGPGILDLIDHRGPDQPDILD
jgi:hypothetical protein